MAITYAKEVLDFNGQVASYAAIKDGVNVFIPKDINNIDYQEILQEVANGSLTITPA